MVAACIYSSQPSYKPQPYRINRDKWMGPALYDAEAKIRRLEDHVYALERIIEMLSVELQAANILARDLQKR